MNSMRSFSDRRELCKEGQTEETRSKIKIGSCIYCVPFSLEQDTIVMCGILFAAYGVNEPTQIDRTSSNDQNVNSILNPFLESLSHRGPDSINFHTIHIDPPAYVQTPLLSLDFVGSILQLRGFQQSCNPHYDENTGNILLFNGEIFGGLDIPPGSNDADSLFSTLNKTSSSSSSNTDDSTDDESIIPRILSRLRGPWALVYWHSATSTLWYGKDVFGRRSLLMTTATATSRLPSFVLTSTYPLLPSPLMNNFEEIEPGLYRIRLSHLSDVEADSNPVFTHHMKGSIGSIERIEWMDEDVTSIKKFSRLKVHDDDDGSVGNENNEMICDAICQALKTAVEKRCCIETVQKNVSNSLHDETHRILPAARLMILFSGGVDSTLLAALAHETLNPGSEPIDLVSICFANGTSPDRLAALDAYEELVSMAPERPWRLIGVDRSLNDVEAVRPYLRQLLAPCDTVMDLNIGAALWLAAEGCGIVLKYNGTSDGWIRKREEEDLVGCEYRSRARCVFLGHGADELFGGYGRHRTKFREGGWQGMSDELALDVKRLWIRNLGRDDRLIADRGREGRHPFLDEDLVLESLKWPLSSLVDLRLEPGVGDKKVLREILARRFGLVRAARRVKRAIQFGTRLAKAVNVEQFGGTRKANARSAGSVRLDEVG